MRDCALNHGPGLVLVLSHKTTANNMNANDLSEELHRAMAPSHSKESAYNPENNQFWWTTEFFSVWTVSTGHIEIKVT